MKCEWAARVKFSGLKLIYYNLKYALLSYTVTRRSLEMKTK